MEIGKSLDLDIIHSDFKNLVPGVLGFRLGHNISSRIGYGVSIVGDANQLAGLDDKDGDGVFKQAGCLAGIKNPTTRTILSADFWKVVQLITEPIMIKRAPKVAT